MGGRKISEELFNYMIQKKTTLFISSAKIGLFI